MNESLFFIPFCSHFFSWRTQTGFFVEITQTLCHDKIVLIPYSMLLFMTQRTLLRMNVTRTSQISVYEYDADMYMYAMIKNGPK